MPIFKKYFFALVITFFCTPSFNVEAQEYYEEKDVKPGEIFTLKAVSGSFYITDYLFFLEDSLKKLSFEDVISKRVRFESYQNIEKNDSFHRPLKKNTNYWATIKIKNDLNRDSDWVLFVGSCSYAEVYIPSKDGSYQVEKTGMMLPVSERSIKQERSNKIKFMLPEELDELEIFIRLETGFVFDSYFNVALKSPNIWNKFINDRNLVQGFFQGILWIMILYNLSIFISVRDKTYLFYAFYMISLSVFFFFYYEFNSEFFFGEFPEINPYASFGFSNLITIFYILFMRRFLQIKELLPKWDLALLIWVAVRGIFLVIGLITFMGNKDNNFYADSIVNIFFTIEVIFNFFVLVVLFLTGNRLAKYFIGGSFCLYFGLLLSIFGWENLLVDYGIIGLQSAYFLQLGVVSELFVFSVGLGYRIRLIENEKRETQEWLIYQLKVNEKLQNKVNKELERKVNERTAEIAQQTEEIRAQSENLKEANYQITEQKEKIEKAFEELHKTYEQLKRTQSNLVESEKMASLGQLTAGIAHEINNPINFVSANIRPLKMDFMEIKGLIKKMDKLDGNGGIASGIAELKNYKQDIDIWYLIDEIDQLLNGIEIGASRTTQIIKGLRSFSRLDESNWKLADIHEGLENTLLLLNSMLKDKIALVKNYDKELPLVECYPGKLNQVFMNIIVNAIQAINANTSHESPCISITSKREGEFVKIHIKDTGSGMEEKVISKIFEPFYTTKPIGEGTGLGLSISYGIIEQHNGKILVSSKKNYGTEISILLPLQQNT